MELLKFILWLTAGAVIGWFASRIVVGEQRRSHALEPGEIGSS